MEALNISETSVKLYGTTPSNVPEDGRYQDMKSSPVHGEERGHRNVTASEKRFHVSSFVSNKFRRNRILQKVNRTRPLNKFSMLISPLLCSRLRAELSAPDTRALTAATDPASQLTYPPPSGATKRFKTPIT